jgi:hypothetical protein
MPTEIVILGMLRAIVEVAGLMILLRGAMWLFGPKGRRGNFVYDILTIGATPFVNFTRALMPRMIRDVYVPTIAFLLLFALWIGLGLGQQSLCAARAVKCF